MPPPADILSAIQSAARARRTPIAPPSPTPAVPRGTPPPVATLDEDILSAIRSAAVAALPTVLPEPAAAPQPPRVAARARPAPRARKSHHHETTAPPPSTEGGVSEPHLRHMNIRRAKADKLLPFIPAHYQRLALDIGLEDYEREQRNSPGSMNVRMRDSLAGNKGDLVAARTTLVLLVKYLKTHRVITKDERTIPPFGADGQDLVITDFYLDGFLSENATTTAARKRRRVALQFLRDAAGFRLRVGRQCLKKLVISGSRPKGKKVPMTADPSIIYHYELIAGDTNQRSLIRQSAGMAVASGHICLRWANAQRTGKLYLCGDILRGTVAGDYKKADETIMLDRPFCASSRGLTGRSDWVEQLQLGLVGVEQKMYLIRETDSDDGDPRRATSFIDEMMEETRALNMIRALLYVPAPYPDGYRPFPVAGNACASALTFKCLRRYLPALAKAAGENKEDVNEIGAWAGSHAERIDNATLDAASKAASACADLYSTEGAEARVPYIMIRVANMATRALGSSLAAGKCQKGFAMLARMHIEGKVPLEGAPPPVLAAVAPAPPLAVGNTSGRAQWHGPARIASHRSEGPPPGGPSPLLTTPAPSTVITTLALARTSPHPR